jgi:hypothetical protein
MMTTTCLQQISSRQDHYCVISQTTFISKAAVEGRATCYQGKEDIITERAALILFEEITRGTN